MPRILTPSLAALTALALVLTACGDDGMTDPGGAGDPDEPVTSAPDDGDDAAGDDDATGDDPDGFGDEFDVDTAIEDARAVLGVAEEDLQDDVRIARRGDETFALTEDYVLGRRTVELDDDGGGYRVTSVVVELPDGPQTFELEPS
jgi:hypothetical protein